MYSFCLFIADFLINAFGAVLFVAGFVELDNPRLDGATKFAPKPEPLETCLSFLAGATKFLPKLEFETDLSLSFEYFFPRFLAAVLNVEPT